MLAKPNDNIESIDEAVFEMLHAAVTLARDEQIRSVGNLRSRLNRKYPDRASEIDCALRVWGQYEYDKKH